MKRNKKIGILCGILICVSLAAFGVSKYEKQKEIIKNSDEIIMEIKKEDVKVLSWECDMGSFAFHRDENGSWLYDEDEEFPVDKEKIENLLELFEEFGVAFMIEEVEDFGQYGLDTPVCTICMETASDSYEIRLGNYSTMDSQRYVSIGDGNVYLVKTDPLEQFELEISEVFHHDEIPELKDVTQIQLSGTESEDIIYEKDSTNTYSSEDVYFVKREESLLPLDTSRVQEYLDTVNNLKLENYVNYKASEEDMAVYGLDKPELSVVFEYTDIGEDANEETKETFALYIGRDPKEQEVEESDKDTDKDTEEEVTAYARIGESKIIYQLTTEQYKKLKEVTYDTLRHQELFWADFSEVHQLDILLEDKHYIITSELEDGDRTYYYQEEELEMANIRSAISGLKVKTFSDETPKQKEEISLTLYLDNENFPKVHIQLYRYDGEDCIAVVDGETVALVERTCVVDLIEAVNHIVLK
ncbi:MAG: DUF4340 domain-containing protein [Lachnospiraceae bacterium]|nr:DUF4340 domain-containing protein [Lachnospiraceae bacterium]